MRWIKDRDNRYYSSSVYFNLFFISFIIDILFIFFIDIKLYWMVVSNLISLFILFFIKIKDGEKEISEIAINDYLKYILYQILGCVIGCNITSILYCQKRKLNMGESFNLYSLNVLALNISRLVKTSIVINIDSFIILLKTTI